MSANKPMICRPTLKRLLCAIFVISATLTAIVLPGGCSKGTASVHPTGWSALGGEPDSLTRRIEIAFLDGTLAGPIDSLVNAFANAADRNTPEVRSRILFWKGRVAMRQGDMQKRDSLFDLALDAAPDETAKYIRRREQWVTENSADFSRTQYYRLMLDDINFYKRRQDYIMLYVRYEAFTDLMRDIGLRKKAEEYSRLVMTTARHLSPYMLDLGPEMTRIALLWDEGKNNEIKSILDSLSKVPGVMENELYYQYINQAYYETMGDTAALRRAYNSVKKELHSSLGAQICAEMAHEALKRGNTAEAAECLAVIDSSSHANAIQSTYHLYISRARAELAHAHGDTREALDSYIRYSEKCDSIIADLKQNEVADLQTADEIRHMEFELAKHKRNRTLLIWGIIIGSCMIIAILTWIAVRRLKRLRQQNIISERERMASEQREQILQMKSERDGNAMKETMGRLRELKDSGELPEGTDYKIGHILSTHHITERESEQIHDTFLRLHPRFVNTLRTQAPGISDSALLLAGYIAMGMNTVQIAGQMRVQPGSVKQARWRLRKTLGLSGDTDLRGWLSSILNDQ